MKVYCHGMNTSSPKEFITLPAGVQNNYAYIYAKRLPHRPYSARYKCSGTPGRMNYTAAGLSRFRKVRVDLSRMAIIGDDFTFAKSNPFGKRIPYGSAGDCFSMHFGGKCRRGHFKVDLSQTGLRLKPSVRWKAIGFPPGIEMHEYKKSKDGTMVSAKCGGWCGQCRPVGEMLLEQTVCSQEEGELIDGAFAHKPTPFKIYTKDGPSLSSAPPPPPYFSHFHRLHLSGKHGQLFRGFSITPCPPTRPLGVFVLSPVYLVVIFKMADKADRGTSEMFSVKMSVNSPENVLTHASSYSFRFYGVQCSLEPINERARNFVIARKNMSDVLIQA